jgi:hypothetical protein
MAGAIYICQLGCDSTCRHKLPCVVFRTDAEHPHPPKHVGVDDDQMIHEWVGKGTGRCVVSAPRDED